MRRTYLKTLAGTAAVLLSFAAAGCGARGWWRGGDAEYTIKFSHVVTRDTPKGKAAEEFKKILEERTDGKIPSRSTPTPSSTATRTSSRRSSPTASRCWLPQVPSSRRSRPAAGARPAVPVRLDQGHPGGRLQGQHGGQGHLREQEARRQQGQGDGSVGQRAQAALLQRLDEAALGPRWPELQDPALRRAPLAVQELGCQRDADGLSEVYNALQQKVVDGQENPYSNIGSQKMHTVQKHITESNHGYIGYVLVINNEFLELCPTTCRPTCRRPLTRRPPTTARSRPGERGGQEDDRGLRRTTLST